MKTLMTILSFIFLLCQNCLCQTQTELTHISAKNLKNTELAMDSIFRKIQKNYSKDTLFIKNIKASQKTWNTYYLNQIKAMFPDYPSGDHYGSMLSMCVTSYAKKIVEARVQELEQWLIGRDDGDCSSSIKNKGDLPSYKPYSSDEDIP